MSRSIDASELLLEIQACNWDSDQDRERAEDLVLGMPALTPPNEWVSVENALPPELKMVLVYCGGLYCVAGWVRDEAGEVLWTCKTEPQFWMLIPEVE